MRIGFIGAGSMGGLFAGYLQANGEEVHLFEVRDDIVSEIRENGLRIERPEGTLTTHPSATTSLETHDEDVDFDVVFVLTKAYQTRDGIESFGSIVDEETAVVTLQNGLGNVERIAEYTGSSNVYGGYTTNGANVIEPGRVRQLGSGDTVVGGPSIDAAERIAETLSSAGLSATAVDDPYPHVWDKQFINVGIKPVAALTELTNGRMAEHEETRWLLRTLIEEAITVAEAMGVEIISDDPVEATMRLLERPEKYDKKSSILEDVENERKTEIDYINGAVVDYAEEEGVPAPYNRMATRFVQAKERSYLDGT